MYNHLIGSGVTQVATINYIAAAWLKYCFDVPIYVLNYN